MTTALANLKFEIDLGNDELNKTALAVNGGIIEYQFLLFLQRLKDIDFFYTKRATIESVFEYVSHDYSRLSVDPKVSALKKLKINSWKELLRSTGLYDVLPSERKREWDKQEEWVDFTEENIKSTLFALLQEQGKFTAEKVEGCFRSLSGEHVTNRPEGFSKRLIFQLDRYDGFFHNYIRVDTMHDLRNVILLLTNRGTKFFTQHHTQQQLDLVPHDGQWYDMDGEHGNSDATKRGTAHVELHPDIAWQLNSILATVYGNAIPEKHRRPIKEKKVKHVALMSDFISAEVLVDLNNYTHRNRGIKKREDGQYTASHFNSVKTDSHRRKELIRVMKLIGGVVTHTNSNSCEFVFDYNPYEILCEIQRLGCIPDKYSHQYYPTNEILGMEATIMADIQEGDEVLEPSAGQGGIARFLPKTATLVEVNNLHCSILREKGFENVIEGDFIAHAESTKSYFDVIVMNPPFSNGRAELHLTTALSLLKSGGRLTAILPVTARNYKLPDGYDYEYSSDRNNQFDGTSVSVVILKATRH